MSHEGISAFDNRNPEQERRDERDYYEEKARKQLHKEGGIGHWATNEQFWELQRKINTRAQELKERDYLEKLKRKYE